MSLARFLVTTSMAVATNRNGVAMILSPAKTLDMTPCEPGGLEWTTPSCDEEKTQQVAKAMKKQSEKDLVKLLGVSANLAGKSHKYWSDYKFHLSDRDEPDKKPCIYAFNGAAYLGLDSPTCSKDAIIYLQKNLRILDALYGSLRPLDMIQPYRLEMGTRNLFGVKSKMSEFWKTPVTEQLIEELEPRKDKILVNLASDEYANAVDFARLESIGTKVIKVVFWEEGRVVTVHAKRARGLMARYLAHENVQSMEEIQNFNVEGYAFVAAESDGTKIVFDRKKQKPAKKATNKRTQKSTTKAATSEKKKRTRRK